MYFSTSTIFLGTFLQSQTHSVIHIWKALSKSFNSSLLENLFMGILQPLIFDDSNGEETYTISQSVSYLYYLRLRKLPLLMETFPQSINLFPNAQHIIYLKSELWSQVWSPGRPLLSSCFLFLGVFAPLQQFQTAFLCCFCKYLSILYFHFWFHMTIILKKIK